MWRAGRTYLETVSINAVLSGETLVAQVSHLETHPNGWFNLTVFIAVFRSLNDNVYSNTYDIFWFINVFF